MSSLPSHRGHFSRTSGPTKQAPSATPQSMSSRSPSPKRIPSRSMSRSRSRSPQRRRSVSRSRSRSQGRGRDETNPGNTLFVTGLSSRVTEKDLEDHLSREGKVSSVFLVFEPRTRVSRGFAFVTMQTVEDAESCIKYLNQTVLESRRKRPRTPTPGHYLGVSKQDGYRGGDHGRYRSNDHGRYRGGYGRDDYDDYRRSPRRSSPPPYRGSRGYSPCDSPHGYRSRRERSRSYSPYDSGYGRSSGVYGR